MTTFVVMFLFLVSCVQESRVADVMPRAQQQCNICGEWVSTNHTARHAERRHSMRSKSNVSSRASSSARETVDDREGAPPVISALATAGTTSPTLEYVQATAGSITPSMDYVRSAVLCMLRRVHDVNLPALSSYLASHFPLIPPAWRASIIVAAFTGAQKAAVSHTDAVLQVDQERSVWAKASLSRWAHGSTPRDIRQYHRSTLTAIHRLRTFCSTVRFRLEWIPVTRSLRLRWLSTTRRCWEMGLPPLLRTS